MAKALKNSTTKFNSLKRPHQLVKDDSIDTRFPRMFSDDNSSKRLAQAQRITDLKNLGPSSEAAFHRAGIKTAQQFLRLGWKQAYTKLVQSNPRNCHSMFAYAIIGAVQNLEWNRIREIDKEAARILSHQLRESVNSPNFNAK